MKKLTEKVAMRRSIMSVGSSNCQVRYINIWYDWLLPCDWLPWVFNTQRKIPNHITVLHLKRLKHWEGVRYKALKHYFSLLQWNIPHSLEFDEFFCPAIQIFLHILLHSKLFDKFLTIIYVVMIATPVGPFFCYQSACLSLPGRQPTWLY